MKFYRLAEIKTIGRHFTWNNKQDGVDRVFSRIDRVLENVMLYRTMLRLPFYLKGILTIALWFSLVTLQGHKGTHLNSSICASLLLDIMSSLIRIGVDKCMDALCTECYRKRNG